MVEAIRDQYLVPGDIFVVDNASVHHGAAMWEDLLQLLEEYQISLTFLPTYSPELNPCELCFAMIKNWIRANRPQHGGVSLLRLVCRAAARVKKSNLLRFYRRCVLIKERFVKLSEK